MIAVNEHSFTSRTGETFPHFSIVYVAPDRYGRHRDLDHRWISECVAIDRRILMLFEANGDEVFVVARPRPASAPPIR